MTGNAIERTDVQKPSVRQLIQQMTPEIKKALPAHLDADRIARIAITLIGTNRALAECTPESFLGALMTASQLGLEPGPLGEAYLVPFKGQVTFIPGYRGLIKLAYQSGQMKRIGAHIIREHDEFDYSLGLQPTLTHKPKLGERGKPIGAYASAMLANGETPFIVMSYDEIDRIRRRSRASDKGPWVSDWDAMARKTAIRQLARWLPMSPDLREFGVAVGLEGSVRTQVTATRPDHDEVEYEDPLQLEPPRAPVSGEEIRAASAAAKSANRCDGNHAMPECADPHCWHRDPPRVLVLSEADKLLAWHEAGHPEADGRGRHAWDPECSLCTGNDPGDKGKDHFYGHTVDFVDGCDFCALDLAFKEQTDG